MQSIALAKEGVAVSEITRTALEVFVLGLFAATVMLLGAGLS